MISSSCYSCICPWSTNSKYLSSLTIRKQVISCCIMDTSATNNYWFWGFQFVDWYWKSNYFSSLYTFSSVKPHNFWANFVSLDFEKVISTVPESFHLQEEACLTLLYTSSFVKWRRHVFVSKQDEQMIGSLIRDIWQRSLAFLMLTHCCFPGSLSFSNKRNSDCSKTLLFGSASQFCILKINEMDRNSLIG